MRIGSLRNTDDKLITQAVISWSRRIKVLGMYFSTDKSETIQLNYDRLLGKIDKILKSWHSRNLTLVGKIVVINTLVMPLLVYCFTNTYNPLEETLCKIDKKIRNYLWDTKTDCIRYELLKKTYEQGGLKLVDIRAKCQSLKSKWMAKAPTVNAAWTTHAENVLGNKIDFILNCNINSDDIKKFNNESIWYEIWSA